MSDALLYDTTFKMEYTTSESREASFAPPTKRSKTGGWPHKTPKPADLARAGFYYKPTAQSNDNAVCFMCSRNLDGWEKDDDPIEEHLKHAEDCGWAVMMSIESQKNTNPSEMEDPMGERITEARRATFNAGWPHESKRGWTCKIEKMVEGGWHFAPTAESEDYVSCAYCKLSLDGWEPKDNPFEEHHSRSPDCPFFIFAGTTAPSKRPKAKKGRASRSSRVSRASTRLSTQSNMTLPEVTDIPDLNESIDTSNISIMSTASTAVKGKAKRKATSTRVKTKTKKAKTTKSKKDKTEVEAEAEPEPETLETEQTQEETTTQVIEEKPKTRTKRSKPKKEEPTIVEPPPSPVQNLEPSINEAPLSPVESIGPPEREASMIPVQIPSPVPIRSARRISRTPIKSKQAPKSEEPTQQTSTSDVENDPPSSLPKSARPPLSSSDPKWTPIDVEMIFESTPALDLVQGPISDTERQMTIQDWVKFIAVKAEEDLRIEGERVVGIFEREGQKALKVLEGISCI